MVVPCNILCSFYLGLQAIDRLIKCYLKFINIPYKNKKLFREYEVYDCKAKEYITNDDIKKIKILRIIRYDEDREEFIRFTSCDKWREQLTL